jgi:hypothetical protein
VTARGQVGGDRLLHAQYSYCSMVQVFTTVAVYCLSGGGGGGGGVGEERVPLTIDKYSIYTYLIFLLS